MHTPWWWHTLGQTDLTRRRRYLNPKGFLRQRAAQHIKTHGRSGAPLPRCLLSNEIKTKPRTCCCCSAIIHQGEETHTTYAVAGRRQTNHSHLPPHTSMSLARGTSNRKPTKAAACDGTLHRETSPPSNTKDRLAWRVSHSGRNLHPLPPAQLHACVIRQRRRRYRHDKKKAPTRKAASTKEWTPEYWPRLLSRSTHDNRPRLSYVDWKNCTKQVTRPTTANTAFDRPQTILAVPPDSDFAELSQNHGDRVMSARTEQKTCSQRSFPMSTAAWTLEDTRDCSCDNTAWCLSNTGAMILYAAKKRTKARIRRIFVPNRGHRWIKLLQNARRRTNAPQGRRSRQHIHPFDN